MSSPLLESVPSNDFICKSRHIPVLVPRIQNPLCLPYGLLILQPLPSHFLLPTHRFWRGPERNKSWGCPGRGRALYPPADMLPGREIKVVCLGLWRATSVCILECGPPSWPESVHLGPTTPSPRKAKVWSSCISRNLSLLPRQGFGEALNSRTTSHDRWRSWQTLRLAPPVDST